LRSPNVSNTNNSRIVNTSGVLNNNNSNNSNAISPDCIVSELKVNFLKKIEIKTNICKELLSCPLKRQIVNVDATYLLISKCCYKQHSFFY